MTRDRGSYGPLDRARNPAASWGEDRVTEYLRDRTIGRAAAAVLPTVDLASRAARAASHLHMGTRGLGGREEAQKPMAQVGQEFFHSISDRTRAVAALSAYFQALVTDLSTWMLAHPDKTVVAMWVDADVIPLLEEWRRFCVRQDDSWWSKTATAWDAYTEFFDRLRTMRSLARAHGVVLQSAEPVPLPKTIWERSAEGNGSKMASILGVVKVGAFAAITIAGAVTLFGVVRDLRRPKQEKQSP